MSDLIETGFNAPAASEGAGDDMHIHKPKAAHSLREFLSEISVIVVGICIALGLEQGVEAIHWGESVSKAREALHKEIASDDGYFSDRIAVSPCVDRHIAQTSALIEAAANTGRTPEVNGVALSIGHFLDTSEWEAQKAAQTLVHFPAEERSLLSVYYRQTDDIAAWRNEERAVWDGLAILDGAPKRLSDADIAGLRIRLKQAEHLQRLMENNASVELDRGRRMGIAPHAASPSWRAQACQDIRRSQKFGAS